MFFLLFLFFLLLKLFIFQNVEKFKNPYASKAQTKFRMRLNNYKSAHKSFKTKKLETQKLFHGHHIQNDHEGKGDWQFTLIDDCTTNPELRKREVYWQHRLKIFFPIYFKHIIYVIITIVFFSFKTAIHWGRIQRMNPSGMLYPYPLVTLGTP